MGRARRMVGYFMQDFVSGYMESLKQYDHERINSKVAQTTADDYYDYQNRFTNDYGPPYAHRRNDEGNNVSKNPPVIQKIDPKVFNVVEMLKNLKPKANQNDSFIIRYARALNHHSRNENTTNTVDHKFPTVSLMELQKYLQTSHHDKTKVSHSINETKNGRNVDIVEGRSLVRSYGQHTSPNLNMNNNNNIKRIFSQGSPPPGLPSFDELPPADCEAKLMMRYFNHN